jgi:hypothetical protein
MTTRTRFSQDSLPPAIKMLWKSVFIPTFRAHIASLRSANPFSLSDPVDLIQLVAKEVYVDQYANLKKSQSMLPKGVVFELVSFNLLEQFANHTHLLALLTGNGDKPHLAFWNQVSCKQGSRSRIFRQRALS